MQDAGPGVVVDGVTGVEGAEVDGVGVPGAVAEHVDDGGAGCEEGDDVGAGEGPDRDFEAVNLRAHRTARFAASARQAASAVAQRPRRVRSVWLSTIAQRASDPTSPAVQIQYRPFGVS